MDKYKTYLSFLIAKVQKNFKRHQISKLFSWQPLPELETGCTAIIAMCSRMPDVLGANLYCLNKNKWDGLKEVLITVDAEKGVLPSGFEDEIIKKFPQLKVTFLYYNRQQAEFTAKVNDPYIYSWLSWGTCMNHVSTKIVLIQDYDALVLSGKALEKRYHAFLESGAKIQGITWCKIGGFEAKDHLATTFEAFMDVNWIRTFPPVMGYNRVGLLKERKVDYDTYLDIQANHTPENQRTIIPMSEDELVHPSQMITQYMRFRNSPGKVLPCFAVTMIPFFYFISGQENAIINATQALQLGKLEYVDLLSDAVIFNFSQLDTKAVDFMLKLMVQALIGQGMKPFKELIDYGMALYKVCKTPPEQIWVGDFTTAQREWIKNASL
ncbi:MAG: hypothetical protein DRR16_32345 [Candidatus Parabeggiatoa sp. nov. 3]|nr:MAG: hypothetical protein DRR00_32420 [Gammaproteobacteria bacterium]RKZ54487.1 MAG: hypothetical protein DRQ99_31165 [Gammaproteobacteria bacterium]RKZ74212.1 MAG: hypothetical protein DRR16_32345 [Gammaproteobacteria bacterium]